MGIMKIRSLLPLALFTLCAMRAEALTEKGQQALKQLQTALVAEAKAEKPSASPNEMGGRNIKQSVLPRIQEMLANTDSPQWMESMGQMMAYFTSEAVTQNYATLRQEVRAEKDVANQAALSKIAALLEKAGKDTRAAKTAADLDGTIADLTPLRQRYNRGQQSEELQAAYAQVEPTLQFVTYWQNYLAAKSTSNREAASQSLQNLLNNSNGIFLIPRSELLALNARGTSASNEPELPDPREALQKIIDETKSLADVEGTLRKLGDLRQRLNRTNRQPDALNALTQNLQPLDRSYQDFKAGLAVNVEINSFGNNGSDLGNALISRLKAELLLLVLPRYVGAPDGTAAKPGEDVSHFLERVISEARERADINVATRAREALRVLSRGQSFSSGDTSGLSAFVAGQNQETAGQYLPAVISYQTALKSGSDLVPSKIIGERLAAIEAAHPKEFAAAMERFLNPPVPRYDMARPDNFPYQRGNPNAQPAPALAIPPAPVSSPSPTPPAMPTPSAAASPVTKAP